MTVQDELFDVNHKWYDIGLRLGVDYGTLESIKHQYPQDMSTSMREMLARWLKRIDPLATWETLATVLQSRIIGEATLAQQLKSKYCTPVAGMIHRIHNI